MASNWHCVSAPWYPPKFAAYTRLDTNILFADGVGGFGLLTGIVTWETPHVSVAVSSPLSKTEHDSPCGPTEPVSPFEPGSPAAPVAPVAPCGPVAPVAPLGPCGPVAPVSPFTPCGPAVPAAFHEIGTSLFRHAAALVTMRS